MHSYALLQSFTLSLIAGTSMAAEEPSVRLVQYQVGVALSDKVPFSVKPMNHAYGAKLAFLIEGEDLVAIPDDALTMTKMAASDGSELAPLKGRAAAWEQASFPKISDDGTVGSFGVEIRGDLMGRLEGATLEGTITVRTGAETEEAQKSLTLGGDSEKFGELAISAESSEGFGGTPSLSVEVKGDHESIVEIKAIAEGKELDSNGASWSGQQKTYNFEATDAEEIEVKVSYWTNLKEIEVPFSLVVGSSEK